MISGFFMTAGIVGLAYCAAVRFAPQVKSLVKKQNKPRDFHDIVCAYAVLEDALQANGDSQTADELRTKILPAAVRRKELTS